VADNRRSDVSVKVNAASSASLEDRKGFPPNRETIPIASPPNRSQIQGKSRLLPAGYKAVSQSGFGGSVNEKIKTTREAAPILSL